MFHASKRLSQCIIASLCFRPWPFSSPCSVTSFCRTSSRSVPFNGNQQSDGFFLKVISQKCLEVGICLVLVGSGACFPDFFQAWTSKEVGDQKGFSRLKEIMSCCLLLLLLLSLLLLALPLSYWSPWSSQFILHMITYVHIIYMLIFRYMVFSNLCICCMYFCKYV